MTLFVVRPSVRAASAAVRRVTPHQWRIAAAAVAAWGAVLVFLVAFGFTDDLRRRADPGPPMVPITAYPELEAAVRTYYERYEHAQASCDIATFLKHYPDLASSEVLASGINIEQRMITSRCDHVKAIRFDLEYYEPMRVHVHQEGADVKVHGMEHWDYKTGTPGAGEFMTTLSLRQVAGSWTVVRTDGVTLGELHDQR